MKGLIKRELEDSVINGEWYENKELEEKASNAEKRENAAAVIRKFEDITKSKKIISSG